MVRPGIHYFGRPLLYNYQTELKCLTWTNTLAYLSGALAPKKKFYIIETRIASDKESLPLSPEANVIKLFKTILNECKVISKRVCHWQDFPVYSQTLDQSGKACQGQTLDFYKKILNYGYKSYITLASLLKVIEHFGA